MLYLITKYFIFCGYLSVNIIVKDNFLRWKFPLKAMETLLYVHTDLENWNYTETAWPIISSPMTINFLRIWSHFLFTSHKGISSWTLSDENVHKSHYYKVTFNPTWIIISSKEEIHFKNSCLDTQMMHYH